MRRTARALSLAAVAGTVLGALAPVAVAGTVPGSGASWATASPSPSPSPCPKPGGGHEWEEHAPGSAEPDADGPQVLEDGPEALEPESPGEPGEETLEEPETLPPDGTAPDAGLEGAATDALLPDAGPEGAGIPAPPGTDTAAGPQATDHRAAAVRPAAPETAGPVPVASRPPVSKPARPEPVRPGPTPSRSTHCAPAPSRHPTPPAHHGVDAGGGGAFTDSVPALAAGGLLIAGAFGAAAHRVYRDRTSRPDA